MLLEHAREMSEAEHLFPFCELCIMLEKLDAATVNGDDVAEVGDDVERVHVAETRELPQDLAAEILRGVEVGDVVL